MLGRRSQLIASTETHDSAGHLRNYQMLTLFITVPAHHATLTSHQSAACQLLLYYHNDAMLPALIWVKGQSNLSLQSADCTLIAYSQLRSIITFCVSRRRRKMNCGHARLCLSDCLCVCVSVRGRMPRLLHGPRCNLGEW